ncbi:MAG: hypothetical protein P0S96_01180 [Simkaniaceae bacterium]|nr:hypothetical protein [Candidatus Sacchlamyda saccharinae]
MSLEEVRDAFDNLINKSRSREEISSWAENLQLAEDNNDLEYYPKMEGDKIWDALDYLNGVDLRDLDGSYLHSQKSFIDYKTRNNL